MAAYFNGTQAIEGKALMREPRFSNALRPSHHKPGLLTHLKRT